MKQLILILLLFPITLLSQYNKVDTTYLFNYKQLSKIHKEIEVCKNTRFLLQEEIDVLIKQDQTKSLIIAKLKLRDSLYQKELEKAAEIEDLFREKLIHANDIINNYKILLLTSEEQLEIEARKAKRERFFKNLYLYGIPAAGVLTILLIK